jgi:hypothetical protein
MRRRARRSPPDAKKVAPGCIQWASTSKGRGAVKKSLAELAVRMHETVDLRDERELKKFMGFTPVGENLIGIRRIRAPGKDSHGLLEIGPNGIQEPPRDHCGIHVVYGGTPHHSPRQFGYWHINDVDEVYLRVPDDAPSDIVTHVLLMRLPRAGERDMFAWYCMRCVTLLYCHIFDSGRLGWGGFWRAEDQAVETFNGESKLRVCLECGWESPLGYRGLPGKNRPEEEAVRAIF